MKRLLIAAVGLALVVGVVVGGMVGNPFGRSAPASAAGVGGRLISLGTVTVPAFSSAAFPIVDAKDCAQVRAMISSPGSGTMMPWFNMSPDGTTVVAGSALVPEYGYDGSGASILFDGAWPYFQLRVISNLPSPADVSGWLWCTTSPASSGRLIELGTVYDVNDAVFPIVDVRDCAQITAMARAPDELGYTMSLESNGSPDGTTTVMNAEGLNQHAFVEDGASSVGDLFRGAWPYFQLKVHSSDPAQSDITAWLWCATSPTYAVGGIAELPALAGPAGTSGMGGATYAVLAGAAAGVLAFAVLATLSVKRWRAM
jgi:hypothetical protein